MMSAAPAGITGWARVIGHNTLSVDDADPWARGFQLI